MLLKVSQSSESLHSKALKYLKAKTEWDEDDKHVVDIPMRILRPATLVTSPTRPGQSVPLLPQTKFTPAVAMSPTGLQLSLQKRTPLEAASEDSVG